MTNKVRWFFTKDWENLKKLHLSVSLPSRNLRIRKGLLVIVFLLWKRQQDGILNSNLKISWHKNLKTLKRCARNIFPWYISYNKQRKFLEMRLDQITVHKSWNHSTWSTIIYIYIFFIQSTYISFEKGWVNDFFGHCESVSQVCSISDKKTEIYVFCGRLFQVLKST